ncbi:MAG: hypothetical protein ACI8TA_003660, partial [Cyclobacteriaceae bacterium]
NIRTQNSEHDNFGQQKNPSSKCLILKTLFKDRLFR